MSDGTIANICKGLSLYYKRFNQPYDALFTNYCDDNGFDEETVLEELQEPTDCLLVDFDDEFPFEKEPKDKLQAIFDIIDTCKRNPHYFDALPLDAQKKFGSSINFDELLQNLETCVFTKKCMEIPNPFYFLSVSTVNPAIPQKHRDTMKEIALEILTKSNRALNKNIKPIHPFYVYFAQHMKEYTTNEYHDDDWRKQIISLEMKEKDKVRLRNDVINMMRKCDVLTEQNRKYICICLAAELFHYTDGGFQMYGHIYVSDSDNDDDEKERIRIAREEYNKPFLDLLGVATLSENELTEPLKLYYDKEIKGSELSEIDDYKPLQRLKQKSLPVICYEYNINKWDMSKTKVDKLSKIITSQGLRCYDIFRNKLAKSDTARPEKIVPSFNELHGHYLAAVGRKLLPVFTNTLQSIKDEYKDPSLILRIAPVKTVARMIAKANAKAKIKQKEALPPMDMLDILRATFTVNNPETAVSLFRIIRKTYGNDVKYIKNDFREESYKCWKKLILNVAVRSVARDLELIAEIQITTKPYLDIRHAMHIYYNITRCNNDTLEMAKDFAKLYDVNGIRYPLSDKSKQGNMKAVKYYGYAYC